MPPGNPSKPSMSEQIDRLCEQLCLKGNGNDGRIEARKANGVAMSEKYRHAVGSQLDRAERL
jgi:hypothetical protein